MLIQWLVVVQSVYLFIHTLLAGLFFPAGECAATFVIAGHQVFGAGKEEEIYYITPKELLMCCVVK